MPSVRGSVMTGDGQRHHQPPVPLLKTARLHGGKVVGLAHVRVDGKVAKADPWHAGNRIGILRRQPVRLREHAMLPAIVALIVEIRRMKGPKILVIGRPHQRKRVIVLVKRRVERGERVIVSQLPLPLGQPEFRLLAEAPRRQPQQC